MKSIIRNRFFLAVICLLLALTLAFFVTPALVKAQNQLVEVAALSQDVAADTRITEEMVTLRQVRSSNIPLRAVRDRSKLVGKYSAVPIFEGDFITPAKLLDELPANHYLQQLPEGRTAVSVAVSGLSAAIGGQLTAGDSVQVVAFSRYQDALLTDPLLSGIAVGDIMNADGMSIRSGEADIRGSAEDRIPSAVTFICTEEQALRIIEFAGRGDIHLVLMERNPDS